MSLFCKRSSLLFLSVALATVLTGCGAGPVATNTGTLHLQGLVHGGQQPVSGSTIQLYAAGTGGNGQAASPLIPTSQAVYSLGGANGCNPATQTCYKNVLSDAGGNFTITGDYICPGSNPQVYLAATGGNPGINGLNTNPALTMMAALGPCNNLGSINNIQINELSTVSAVWALSQFMTSYGNVSSTSSNTTGIANAFADAGLLVTSYNPGFPSSLTVETSKLNSLADALAPCVNSDGTTGCAALFTAATPAGGTAPTDTIGAALNIVRNPGQNVGSVFNASLGFQPFLPALTQQPHDWTMSMTVNDSSFLLPIAINIDANGYIWLAGREGGLYELSPQGRVLSGSSSFGLYLQQVFGMTIDSSGYIWVSDYQSQYNSIPNGTGHGALVQFQSSSSGGTTGAIVSGGFREDSSIQYPYAVSADTNGDVFLLNSDPASVSVYTNGLQNPVSASLGQYVYNVTEPLALAVDNAHGFWISDDDNTVSHYSASGAALGYVNCCYQSYGVATDNGGNLWVANYGNSTYSEVTNANSVPLNKVSGGGVYYPAGVSVDAGQNVWFANRGGGTISEIAGNAGTVLRGTTTALAAGTAISPSTGTNVGNGGYGADASLSQPMALVPDASGNVWVANEGNNDVVVFFGLATPTKMPVMPSPAAP